MAKFFQLNKNKSKKEKKKKKRKKKPTVNAHLENLDPNY